MTLFTQWTTMVVMFGSGLLLGMILDAYRVLKGYFGLKSWTVSFVDLLYWVVSAGLVFSVLFWSNWGDFRFYIFLAIFLGMFIYYQWCSKKVIQSYRFLLRIIEKLIHQIYWIGYHLIWVPIIHIWAILKKVCMIGKNILKNLFLFSLRPFNWVFQPIQRKISPYIKKYFNWYFKLKKWWIKRKRDD